MIFELLAPAGNLEKLKIAVLYGADAVYLAGQLFSLRKAANNFSLDDIRFGIEFAHNRGKKVYITVNAFLHESETEQLVEYLQELELVKPDALICSDLGIVKLATRHTTIPIHISTQTSVINSYHAAIWKDLGAKRIVVGRELSIKNAAELKSKTGLEIEMFIHGAMCMGYSGHCAMSTYVAQRDSNRGGCIQNCRYFYTLRDKDEIITSGYLLSSKDLCGLPVLRDFISAGIDSIKIEGRMKSNLYIASTVRAYANAILAIKHHRFDELPVWNDELKKIPYRGYTLGSLVKDADLDSVYDQSREIGKEFKMAGTVIDTDPQQKRFAFQVKNKLNVGDTIELMPFSGSVLPLTLHQLIDFVDMPLKAAQPHNVIWLPWQKEIEPGNVARMMVI